MDFHSLHISLMLLLETKSKHIHLPGFLASKLLKNTANTPSFGGAPAAPGGPPGAGLGPGSEGCLGDLEKENN